MDKEDREQANEKAEHRAEVGPRSVAGPNRLMFNVRIRCAVRVRCTAFMLMVRCAVVVVIHHPIGRLQVFMQCARQPSKGANQSENCATKLQAA